MEIKFVKLNPTQNMTILVESHLPREQHGEVARELMKYEGLFAEQVGFIEKPENPGAWARLQMMGGEFCGNATMSLAAFLAIDRGLPEGEAIEMPLEVSGLETLIPVTLTRQGMAAACSLAMPAPEKIETVTLSLAAQDCRAIVVTMEGITHIILDTKEVSGDKEIFAERAIREMKDTVKSEALGLILYDRVRNSIKPLIYVASTGSQVWERGCASGTAALGAALAHQAQGTIGADVTQPGGVISVLSSCESGKITKTTISGCCKLVARGVAYL